MRIELKCHLCGATAGVWLVIHTDGSVACESAEDCINRWMDGFNNDPKPETTDQAGTQ